MHISTLDLLFWIVLFVIGVSDAQRHRIPNKLVMMLLGIAVLHVFFYAPNEWMDHLIGGLIAFGVSFLFYWLRAMGAGDVKLLFVIGLWVGSAHLSGVFAAILLAGGVVSCFYLAQYLASSDISWRDNVRGYYYHRATYKFRFKAKLVIPFAPSVVIGLASYDYLYL